MFSQFQPPQPHLQQQQQQALPPQPQFRSGGVPMRLHSATRPVFRLPPETSPMAPTYLREIQPDFQMMQAMAQQLWNLSNTVNLPPGMQQDVNVVVTTGTSSNPTIALGTFDENNYFVADDIPQRGISNDLIAAIPLFIARGTARDQVCTVCHENYTSAPFYKQLPCGHQFHSMCINEWLSRNTKCPVCRHEIKR